MKKKKKLFLQSKRVVPLFTDTGAGHNIFVPPSVAEAYYRQVPGSILNFRILANTTSWYVYLLH